MHDYKAFGLAAVNDKSPIQMSVRSKAWVRSRLIAGVVGSDSVEDMDVLDVRHPRCVGSIT